jgi:predicted dinucleotide-binding enzyme
MPARPGWLVAGMTTIGFIGSGNIGSTLARLALVAGHDVVMSNSRGPETLSDLVADLGPRARAATAEEAARAAEIAVVTVPLKSYRQVPVAPLAGKIVIDTNNYYWERDGRMPELDAGQTTTAELLQAHLPESRVVKAFNHIRSDQLATQGVPSGEPGRRALAIAGDDAGAKATVAALIDELGYDVVDAGPLAEGWRIERDTPGYDVWLDREGLVAALAAAGGHDREVPR